ncbi:MAG: hypothetical protein A3I77_08265 [Gammaproteobacteria bacterium RIFCSPLOWO2_02_FULL_42_14]|nr:MAG: hypothetical protein A3B71_04100 [Gammaproteobacteria bacterium RIFCSPHIGHO2_02_FULL_42_43]OGT27583.1 MAG: hypothetical protein A2624_00405 [Gammaproteobacteria bacterium RIFCSPHIGHO2_01_FULL_42_8]OGT52902.1 MAG: hypothetical protein A3E54_07425 [Gammaproteobacteria bacterium RIFCSPHIGHO2_12_FULL_41_25]OGT61325.1 MAG: hypothetical protein A3I77_08265 [Gammaproteobacteria bacterium RIFCSPLOWO2_02_FULL_42_14]OGT87254.1 MAG: hypothetical protein A3G86_01990 [Gammaproteobacteria bacterium R
MKINYWMAIFIFLFSSAVFSKTIWLRDLKINNKSRAVEINFVLSGKTSFRSLTLHHPNRFVLDLKNTAHLTSLQRFSASVFSNTPIQDLRYAEHPDGTLRFVFDLKNDVIPQISARQNHLTGDRELQLRFLKTHAITAARDDISKPVYHNVVIVIDPGHGGKDPGAVGAAGTHEKNVVLSISKALQALMNARPGFRAVLTRNTDRYISLRERLRIARKDHADMFIAIHADTWRNRHARGVSVFALSQRGATSEAARWLATRENASELMGGVDLQDKSHLLKSVLINLSQSATIRASLQIGDKVIQSARSITRLHHDRVEQAAFVVLKSPDIPSLLVETGFLSNPDEERRLRNPVFQRNIAKAMMQGICNYFVNYPPRRA